MKYKQRQEFLKPSYLLIILFGCDNDSRLEKWAYLVSTCKLPCTNSSLIKIYTTHVPLIAQVHQCRDQLFSDKWSDGFVHKTVGSLVEKQLITTLTTLLGWDCSLETKNNTCYCDYTSAACGTSTCGLTCDASYCDPSLYTWTDVPVNDTGVYGSVLKGSFAYYRFVVNETCTGTQCDHRHFDRIRNLLGTSLWNACDDHQYWTTCGLVYEYVDQNGNRSTGDPKRMSFWSQVWLWNLLCHHSRPRRCRVLYRRNRLMEVHSIYFLETLIISVSRKYNECTSMSRIELEYVAYDRIHSRETDADCSYR